MVSTPSYDPNALASHDTAAVRKNYDRLSSTRPEPMLNRAIRQTYPPGSTFKLVTAAAALESGKYTPDSPVDNSAHLNLPQTHGRAAERERRPVHERPADPRRSRWRLLQHGVRPARARARATTRCAPRPRSSASTRPSRCRCAPSPAGSRRTRTCRRPRSRRSGSSTCGPPRCRWRMVAAAIANRGVLMKPYLVQRGPRPRPVDARHDQAGAVRDGREPADRGRSSPR